MFLIYSISWNNNLFNNNLIRFNHLLLFYFILFPRKKSFSPINYRLFETSRRYQKIRETCSLSMLVRLSIKMLTVALCKPLRTDHTVVYAKFAAIFLLFVNYESVQLVFVTGIYRLQWEILEGMEVSKKFWSNLLMKIHIDDLIRNWNRKKIFDHLYQISMPNNIISWRRIIYIFRYKIF